MTNRDVPRRGTDAAELPMRVVQVMAGADYGGAEAFFMRLVPALARADVEQRVVIREHAARAATLAAVGLQAVQLRFGGPLDLQTRWRLLRVIRQFRPQVVMTWMNRATQQCPRGRFVHVGRLGGYYDPRYYRRCDHLIANTADIAEHLLRSGFAPNQVHYLPNFVAGEPTSPLPRRSLFTPEGVPLLLALGRLHRNKAFDVLIEALARLPDAYLWLAGEGPERAVLEALAEHVGVKPRIRFLGWREDVPALLAASDILVCPSRHEPLGNVVLEAFAQRVPVVAAASQGPQGLIANGETGLLVPVDDPAALAAAVKSLSRNGVLASRLAEAGRAVYEAEFTEGKVVQRYKAFLEQVGNAG
jgi:glycosyltransferase involved in cell wall biosynthesis